MQRNRLMTAAALAATATLAAGVGSAPAAKTKQVTCSLELTTQGMPNPSSTHFGHARCPAPLGKGVHFNSFTVMPASPTSGAVTAKFKNYFDTGTTNGTSKLTYAASAPGKVAYTGTVKYTGGTGAFKGAKGSGTIDCTSADAGLHKSCTVKTTFTSL